MKSIECKEVIISTLSTRGKGIEHDPVRLITQVFEKDGTIIAEHDPSPDLFTRRDLIDFSKWLKSGKLDSSKVDDRLINNWLKSIEV